MTTLTDEVARAIGAAASEVGSPEHVRLEARSRAALQTVARWLRSDAKANSSAATELEINYPHKKACIERLDRIACALIDAAAHLEKEMGNG